MTYRLTVTYAAGHDSVHTGLTPEQADSGSYAFTNDLITLEGQGITKMVLEVEND